MQQKVIDMDKSADERELERFYKEKREVEIKEALKELRKDREHDGHYGNQILKVKNVFVGNKNKILNQEKNLFSAKSILHGGNLYFK